MHRNNKGISPIVAVAIIVCAVAIVITSIGIYALESATEKALRPTEVYLSGTVTTTGTGTIPEKITFTSKTTNDPYVADAASGSYSISLPNGDTYKVSITWKFAGITVGTADAGTLNLDSLTSSLVKNWAG